MGRQHARRVILSGTIFLLISFVCVAFTFAWTGPSQSAPNGNISAPVNVGNTDQVKNAGLSLNALAVFGNAILSGVSRYLNFGTTAGSGGYGIRDNAGIMEFKNNAGTWSPIGGASGPTPWLVNGTDVYYTGGEVGIGTAIPGATLDVVGGNTIVDNYLYLRDYDDGTMTNPTALISRDGNLVVWNSGFVVGNPGDGTVADMGAGNAYFVGNVGIGTASPSQKLHVAGNLQVDGAITSPEGTLRDDGGGWVRTYGNTGWYNGTYGGGWYMTDTTWLRAYNSKSIYTPGTVQSGALSSSALNMNNGNITNVGSMQGAGATGARINFVGQVIATDYNTSFNINADAWLGYKVQMPNLDNNNGSFVCWVGSNSGKLVRQAGACNTSDARLKEHIQPLQAGLAEILKLNPVTYEWKDKEIWDKGTKLGLIAQEVREVFPEVITGTGTGVDGDWYGVDYTALTAPIIKAIQELKAENDDLRAELKELRELVESK